MRTKAKFHLLFSLLASFSLNPAAHAGPTTLGIYQGNLIEPAPGVSATPALQQYAVEVKLSSHSENVLHLEVTKSNPQLNTSLEISFDHQAKSATVSGANLSEALTLVQGKDKCYSSSDHGSAELCLRPTSLSLSVQDSRNQPIFSLTLEYFGELAAGIVLETPQPFTLDEAITWTSHFEFNTRIQFQTMLQSRFAANGAQLGLLPHLSNGTLITLLGGPITTTLGLIAAAGDLMPFLFPSRWMQAKEAKQLSKAQADTLAIMRGDAALNVELQAYQIDHDTQQIKLLDQTRWDIKTIREKTAGLEKSGLVPAGTTTHMDSILGNLDDAWDDLAYPLQAEYANLSQAMGFINPHTVKVIHIPDTTPTLLNGQAVLKLSDFQDLAQGRSIEIRQIRHLVSEAETAHQADYWSWLDPSANLSQSLGLGLGETLKIDQSAKSSLLIQLSQTASLLLNKLENAIVQYNHAVEDLDDATRNLVLQQRRKADLIVQMDSGNPISPTELTSVPLDLLAWQIHRLDGALSLKSAKAIIERIMLQGNYSNLDGSIQLASNGTGTQSNHTILKYLSTGEVSRKSPASENPCQDLRKKTLMIPGVLKADVKYSGGSVFGPGNTCRVDYVQIEKADTNPHKH